MKAHVMTTQLIEDAPVAGQMLKRLVFEEGVRLIYVHPGGGMVAGFGPLELELTEESIATLVRHGAGVERWEAKT